MKRYRGIGTGGLCYYWQIKQRTVTVPRNQLRWLLCLSEGFPHIRHQTDATRNFLKIFFTIENNFVTFFKTKALKVLNALSLCRTYMYLFILNDFFSLAELCSSAPETPMVLTPRMTSRDRLKKHMITSYDDSGDNYGATSNRVVLLAGGVEPFLAPCELSTESDDNSGQTVSSSSTNYVYFKAPPHENVWQVLWKKRPKNKHFVELNSNFNDLCGFSHSSTFQTRVYFFKPSKKRY